MKSILVLLAAVTLIGSAAAWELSEELSYTYTKEGYEQADYRTILPQVIGTTTGAYAKQPNVDFGEGVDLDGDGTYENWVAEGWIQLDNTLVDAKVDRDNSDDVLQGSGVNPAYLAEGNDFRIELTQGGDATLSTSSKDTATEAEIEGKATAYQNLWVQGEFCGAEADFDSRAIIGFSDVKENNYVGPQNPNHFVVTDVVSANALIDSEMEGASYFDSANLGVKVKADIEQNYEGSGWDDPTYSGGIWMWANFDGACDPFCANPIIMEVNGEAWSGMFPGNGDLLNTNTAGEFGVSNIGDDAYWSDDWNTNPQAQGTNANPGYDNTQWADIFC